MTNSVVNLMHCGRDKGCLEMLASKAKLDATRRFFTRMRTLHGVWITLEIKGEVGKPRVPGFKKGYIKYMPGVQRLKSYNKHGSHLLLSAKNAKREQQRSGKRMR